MAIQDWKQLRELLNQRQLGNTDESKPGTTATPIDNLSDEDRLKRSAINSYLSQNSKSRALSRQAYGDLLSAQKQAIVDFANESKDDYGAFEGDFAVPYEDWIQNPVDYRANSQTSWEKFRNGSLKFFPYMVTTALDNTVGLAAGILNVGNDAINGGKFHPLTSFIDNPFAEKMQQAREWSEEFFPNYRTTEEIENADQWWKYLNANFWGDTFIKNLGFTVGAGLSAGLYAKGFKALSGKVMDRAYKAALAASEGSTEAEAAFQKVLQGGAMQSPQKIYSTLESTRKAYERLGWESQLIGGIGGAMGESRTEALQAAKEFRDEYRMLEQQKFEQKKRDIINELSSDSRYIYNEPVYDGYGNLVGYKPALNNVGKAVLESRMRDAATEYAQAMEKVNEQAERLALGTFKLNMPLLTASNIVMFGRMMSGGFNTQAKAAVKGSFGKYLGKGTVAGAIGKGIYNAGVEGVEELSQKIFSEGEKDISRKNMAAFYNKQYDKQAIKDTADWILSMGQSAGRVVGEGSSWEEFAVGALTGALGMPTRHGWAGGIIGGVQEGMADKRASKDLANRLNETVTSKDFQDRWKGMVRHKALENLKGVSLADENRFAWHNENFEQIMSDIMMFADAGRLEDLDSFVDSISRMSLDDVQKFRSDFIDPNDPEFNRKTDYDVQQWLFKRADEVKRAINQYRHLYDSVNYLSFGTSDPDAINELIYTQAQMKNFEDRYNSIIGDVIRKIRPALEETAREISVDRPTERAKKAKHLLESEDTLRNLFGGLAIDIHASEQDKESSVLGMTLYELDEAKKEEVISLLDDLGAFTKNDITKEYIRDLQKLVKARQEYYVRLFDPKNRKKFLEDFNRDAVKPEEVAEDIAKQERENRVNASFAALSNANNIRDYMNAFDGLEQMDQETYDALMNKIGSDAKLSGFEKQISDAHDFVDEIGAYVARKASESNDDEFKAVADTVISALTETDTDSILKNAPDDTADIRLEIARDILNRLSKDRKAHNMAAAALKEKINNLMQAAGLGEIPDNGPGPGPGNGPGGGGGRGNISQFDRLTELINNITDPANSTLNNLAVGDFTGYDDLSDDEKMKLATQAASKLKDLKAAVGLIALEDDKSVTGQNEEKQFDKSDPRRVAAHEDLVAMDRDSVGGTPFTVDNVTEARKGKRVRYTSSDSATNATLDWMRAHNVQEFVDTGALAKLEEYYESGKDPDLPKKLPIYFIANPHVTSTNPFAVKNRGKSKDKYPTSVNVLLAVEMNDKNRSILDKYGNAKVFSDDTLVTVYDNGIPVKYQVVGEVWNPSPKEIAAREKSGIEYGKAGEGQVYEAMKQRANKIWDHTIGNSILPQYNRDTETSSSDIPAEGKWYVAKIHPNTGDENARGSDLDSGERIYTTLNYIMSGRNITKDTNDDITSEDKISIEDPLIEYGRYHEGDVYFAMPTAKGMIVTDGAPAFDKTSMNAPAGSLWMATKGANGAWSWTALSIARAGEKVKEDSSLMLRAKKEISTMLAPVTFGLSEAEHKADWKRRLDAAIALSKIFYVGKGNSITPSLENNQPVVYVCGAICRSEDDVFDALEANGCRFQVDDDAINNRPMMRELIRAGVLKSEMRSFIRRCVNIGVNPLEDVDENGEPTNVHVVDSDDLIARTAGSAVVWKPSNDNGVYNIPIGNVVYNLNQDGTVTRTSGRFKSAQQIEDPNVIAAVKALAGLIKNPDGFNGKRWSVETKYVYPGKDGNKKTLEVQHTEMYEDEIAGIKVRIIKSGTNGAYRLVINDDFWNSLMQVAKPYGKTEFGSPHGDEREEIDDLNKMRDQELAEKDGGSVQKQPQEQPAQPGGTSRGRIRSAKSILDEDDEEDDDIMKTLGNALREEEEKGDEIDCGRGVLDDDWLAKHPF